MAEVKITPLRESDFKAWSALFKAYIEFYNSTLPEEQYAKTFARILDPSKDLYGLVMRDSEDESKLIGLAHFYPHQSPWGEKPRMHFNDLFIDPNVRAKGYGRKMIMAVAEESKKKDCYMLEWATKHDNVTARKLYDQLAKCEFVEYRMMLG